MPLMLPNTDDRTAIVGSTGSGKTFFAVWLLSTRDWHKRPWIIFDFKGDKLIGMLPAKEISISGAIPKEPGVYVVRPLPGDEGLVSEFFRKVWERENIGIYVDEGYMIPKLDRYFRACLTQGRSKHIEMIVLSQRPLWLDKFVFTEASFFAVMRLNNLDDRKIVNSFAKGALTILPKYHSLWYDVGEQQSQRLLPVPGEKEILDRFISLDENAKAYI